MTADCLVIKLGALGDVVMATGLINCIRQHHAKDRVCLLTDTAFAGLFEQVPQLEVHAFNRHGLIDTLATMGWIRKQRFDRVYDLQSSDRTALVCALSGIPVRAGNHPRYPYTLHPAEKYTGQVHIFERMQEILQAAGVPAVDCEPRLYCPAGEAQQVSSWLQEQGLAAGTFVLMHAGTSKQHRHKRWPYFAQLATALAAAGWRTVWTGAAHDAVNNRELAATTGIDATDRFSLPGLYELGRFARFAVTNDSGPMHILAASGTPVFALFGPTDWRRNHAVGQRERVITPGAGGPGHGRASLADLAPEKVMQALARSGLLPGP